MAVLLSVEVGMGPLESGGYDESLEEFAHSWDRRDIFSPVNTAAGSRSGMPYYGIDTPAGNFLERCALRPYD